LRERHHLTTRHLGDKVGVSGAHISMLETGKSRPGVDLVIRIAQLFNVSADVLLDDALEVDT
jgi:transcriptional regulator with XRE-family HTH domain